MTEQMTEKMKRRKRVDAIKKALLIIAVCLLLASVGLNIFLLIRVIQLNQLIQQLYGLAMLIFSC